MQNLFENVHTVREEEAKATWSERLIFIFLLKFYMLKSLILKLFMDN